MTNYDGVLEMFDKIYNEHKYDEMGYTNGPPLARIIYESPFFFKSACNFDDMCCIIDWLGEERKDNYDETSETDI